MGRRSKIDFLGLTERVVHLYNIEHKTLEEIESILRGEDFDVSREAIRRKVVSTKESAKKVQDSIAKAKVLIDTVRENPNTDVVEATVALMSNILFEYVQSIEDVDSDSLGEVAMAVNRMADSQTKIAKLRLTFQSGAAAAKKAVLQALQTELKAHPDLLQRMTAIVVGLEVKE